MTWATWTTRALALLLVAGGPAVAADDASLARRLAVLESEVARLRGEQGIAGADLARGRAADRRAVVEAALADVAARAVWLAAEEAGMSAGTDGGTDAGAGLGSASFHRRPMLRSADGSFQLGLALHVQTRFVASYLRDPAAGDDGTVTGFDLRRTRLKAVGHVLDERLRFQVGGGFSDDGDPFSLTDAWMEWRGVAASVRVGNFRPVFLREERTSAKELPGVERSLVSRLVRQLRRPGIMGNWRGGGEGGPLRVSAGLQDPGPGLDADAWQVSARAEWKLAGAWRELQDETGFPGGEGAAAIGAGVLHADRAGASGLTQATADLLWKGDGWSLTLVGVLQDVGRRPRAWGATARGGWFVAREVELVGRVQVGDAGDELLALGGGANLFVDGHGLKLQGDVLYAFDGPGGDWRTSSTGWRPASGDGQLVVRLLGQVAF